MRPLLLLLLLLFAFTTGSPAQNSFPVVREDGCDSVTPGGACLGYFEFVNKTDHPVTVTGCTAAGLCQAHHSKDTLFPGDTARIAFEVNKRAYKGEFNISIAARLSDSSTITRSFNYYHSLATFRSEGKGTCNCNWYVPDYPAGNKVYCDSLVLITKKFVQPDTTWRCAIKLHIPATGIPDSIEFLTSADPEFEEELSKHIAEAGVWIPLCTKLPEPGYEACRGLKPTPCYLWLTLEIFPD